MFANFILPDGKTVGINLDNVAYYEYSVKAFAYRRSALDPNQLIFSADGTWDDKDVGEIHLTHEVPVIRLRFASPEGSHAISYYGVIARTLNKLLSGTGASHTFTLHANAKYTLAQFAQEGNQSASDAPAEAGVDTEEATPAPTGTS